jgi:SpoVK/Ycf46/Vps4 family AAA+-type ATPase
VLGGSRQPAPSPGRVSAGFDDLQVPADTRAALRRLTEWVRLRDEVLAGGVVQGLGGKGSGIAALFTGSPGTGKTLAAHVIAQATGLELMQVDLSGVVDKYVGETEKNLERIFAQAENLNVVLFFDEADALFGTRSGVKDSRDRYANQGVSYLLQRMEQFDGVTILATNLRGNLDPAFARRLHFIVHFPDPDEATRARLWRQLLAAAGPPDPADPARVDELGGTVELTGGALRNIVLAATYDAAIEGSGLGHRHLVAAAQREYVKLGRRRPAGLE